MKKYILAALFAFSVSSVGFAQHSDIEFGFLDDGMGNLDTSILEVEAGLFNTDGTGIFEGNFIDLDFGGGSDLVTDNPGFITPSEEGFLVNLGDAVFLRFLDPTADPSTTVGAGFVSFYDPGASGLQNAGTIDISNSTGDSITLDSTTTAADTTSIFLAFGAADGDASDPPTGEDSEPLNEGEIHSHLLFDLQNEGSTPNGALGLFAQFEVDLAAGGGPDGTIDAFSDPFFLVLNAGLDEEVFESDALAAFGVIPEPTSGIILTAIGAAVITRRRRN